MIGDAPLPPNSNPFEMISTKDKPDLQLWSGNGACAMPNDHANALVPFRSFIPVPCALLSITLLLAAEPTARHPAYGDDPDDGDDNDDYYKYDVVDAALRQSTPSCIAVNKRRPRAAARTCKRVASTALHRLAAAATDSRPRQSTPCASTGPTLPRRRRALTTRAPPRRCRRP